MKTRYGRCWALRTGYLILYVLAGMSVNVHADEEIDEDKGLEMHFSNTFEVNYNDVRGLGSASSTLTEGFNLLNTSTINGRGKYGGYDYHFNVGLKVTDDRRNDTNKFSLTNLKGNISNGLHTVNLGNTFEYFSQYSLSSSVIGGSYKYSPDKANPALLTLVGGYAMPRWDSFWDNDTRAIERRVAGALYKKKIKSNLLMGLSFVRTDDIENTRITPTQSAFQVNAFTGTFEYDPIPGLKVKAESSYADSKASPGINSNGTAHKLQVIAKGGPSRVTLEYERVSAGHVSLVGSSSPDREKVKGKWTYKFRKNTSFVFGMLWFHDNLDDKGARTDNYRPNFGVVQRHLFGRKYSTISFNYKFNRRFGASRSTSDQYFTLSFRDKFWIFDHNTNVGFTKFDTANSRESEEINFNTTWSTRHTWGDVVIKPTFYGGIWEGKDELVVVTDQTFELSLGLDLDFTKHNILTKFKVGAYKSVRGNKTTPTDSTRDFARLNIHWKPEFLTKRFRSARIYLRAYINDFNSKAVASDYREISVTTGMTIDY